MEEGGEGMGSEGGSGYGILDSDTKTVFVLMLGEMSEATAMDCHTTVQSDEH